MSQSLDQTTTTFAVEGQFLGFEHNLESKLKYFYLGTRSGRLRIKLCKSLRLTVGPTLTLGLQLKVRGDIKLVNGIKKLKAWSVQPVTERVAWL